MTEFVVNLAQLQMKTTSFVGKRVTTISNESEAHKPHKQGKSNILAITTDYSESCGRSSNWTSTQMLYRNTNGMIR